jgi:cell division septal protein FtsQ
MTKSPPVGRLALAQPRSVRDVIAVPWRPAAAIAIGSCAVLALLYLAARETPVFAVRSIEVAGGSRSVRLDAERAARPFRGESLAALDGGALVDELEALPSVRSATYDRAFPSTLRIFIEPERPLAVARIGTDSWVVSERGRVLSRAGGAGAALPRYELEEMSGVQPGRFLSDPQSKAILAALALLPKRFPARIETVWYDQSRLVLALRTKWGAPELRLGEPVDIGAKLEVAALILRSLSAEERASAGYLDVSVPERTVLGTNSQVSG